MAYKKTKSTAEAPLDLLVTTVDDQTSSYMYGKEEQDVVRGTFELFRITQQDRDRGFQYFDGRDLITYINDSVLRFTTNIDAREDIEDWQARIHDPFTRNKVQAILGRVVDSLPIADFMPRGDEDPVKAEVLNTLYEYSESISDAEKFMVFALEEALVKGTMVGYEGIEVKDKKIREIVKFKNGDNIESKEKTMKIRKLRSYIVPLEDFYPSSVGLTEIDDMPYCFVRKEMPFESFVKEYSNFERSQYVVPNQTNSANELDRTAFKDFISTNTNEGNVEVIKFYSQERDQYIIMANGCWLNPIGNWQISPLPFNHKKLPFWSIRYDLFGADFFYGKSLPDKLSALQDVLNVLHNMLLDQSFLSIFRPIVTSGIDDIEDDFLRPGRRIALDTQGAPLGDSLQVLDMGTPTGWHQFILEYTKRVLEESSIDSVSSGAAGVGGRTTAEEIRTAAAGVTSLLGLFASFIKFGVKDRARLRAANILQFYFDPQSPVLEGVLNKDGAAEASKAFNTFVVDSSGMTPGSRGSKIVEVYAKKSEMPTKIQARIRAKVDEAATGKKISRTALVPEYIRDFEYDIRIIPNPKSEINRDTDRAMEIQFQQTMSALYPDLINRVELAATLAEKFGRDPVKVLKKDAIQSEMAPNPMMEPGQQAPMQGGDNAANTVKGATGVTNPAPIQWKGLINPK